MVSSCAEPAKPALSFADLVKSRLSSTPTNSHCMASSTSSTAGVSTATTPTTTHSTTTTNTPPPLTTTAMASPSSSSCSEDDSPSRCTAAPVDSSSLTARSSSREDSSASPSSPSAPAGSSGSSAPSGPPCILSLTTTPNFESNVATTSSPVASPSPSPVRASATLVNVWEARKEAIARQMAELALSDAGSSTASLNGQGSPSTAAAMWTPSASPPPPQQVSDHARSNERGPRGASKYHPHSQQEGQHTSRGGPRHRSGGSSGRGGHRSHGQGYARGGNGYHRANAFMSPVSPEMSYGYQPVMDAQTVKFYVLGQIEYYFSIENLCRDIFFRRQMDQDGFVPLSVIAGFNRVRALCTDIHLIREALGASLLLELQDDKVRKKEDWQQWVLSPAEPNTPTTPATRVSPVQQ